jgi:hypothetical protein
VAGAAAFRGSPLQPRTDSGALLREWIKKHGLIVLTRNRRDFDLLQPLEPSGGVLFYDRAWQ